MVSIVEQMAKNISLRSFVQADDLKKRLWFTLGALLVYRLGTYIPLPGIDARVMTEIAQQNAGGILGIFNTFSGGALGRMTVFALGVMPYISSSIIVQLLTSVVPSWEALKKEGESGRKKINQYTRYLTVLLSLIQGYGISVGLESLHGLTGSAVIDPGLFFRFSSTITFLGGTLFLMWLGEQITSRGIGNGVSLLIFSGIVAGLPSAIAATLEMGRTGYFSPGFILIIFLIVIAVLLFIVYMERAQRRIVIQYPKRQVGNRLMGGQNSHLPIKLNVSGVIPPIFASSLLLLPMTLSSFSSGADEKGIVSSLASYLSHGQPLYMFLYALLIIFFSFFYTAIVFNPEETADNLKKNGGFVPGYRPGAHTAGFFDYVLTRLTAIGSLYIALICVIPEFFISKMHIPFYLGGTSLLIVVGVSMDTMAQVHSHLLAHQYEGLLKKSRMREKKK